MQPFHVQRMQAGNFKNFQAAADAFPNTTKVKISKASILKITKESPSVVKIKTTFSDCDLWEEVNVLKKGVSKETKRTKD